MATGGYRSLEEEYNLMLQLVRGHVMGRERAGEPLLLQIQRDSADGGDRVTLLLGSVHPDHPEVTGRESSYSGRNTELHVASLPFLAELGPLLLQTLALQVIIGEQRRRMAAPLEQEAVGHLQKMRLCSEIIAQLETEGQAICSICQETFIAGKEVYRLPCGHMFDVDCLQNWLGQTRTCPNCRFMLQDVEQQYKDVVTPVWWCREEDGDEGIEKERRRVASMDRKLGDPMEEEDHDRQRSGLLIPLPPPPPHVTTPLNNDDINEHEERDLHLQQSEESLSFGTVSSLSGTNSFGSRNLFIDQSSGYGLRLMDNILDTNTTTFTPATPLHNPQRAGENFRERLFAEMVEPPLIGCQSEVPVVGRRNRYSPRQQPSPVQMGRALSPIQQRGSSFPPPLTWQSALNTSPRSSLLYTPSPMHSSSTVHSSNNNSGYGLSARMPPLQEGARCSHEVQANNTSSLDQGNLSACGNPRHAVQLLRNRRLDDAHNSQLSSNSILDGANNVHAPRYGPHAINRPIVHTPSPPQAAQLQHRPGPSMLRLSDDRRTYHNRMSGSTIRRDGLRPAGEGRAQIRYQAPARRNHRNLAEYEAIIRGQPRR